MESNLGRLPRVVAVALSLTASVVAAERPASDLQPELRRLLAGDLKFSSADIADLEHKPDGRQLRHAGMRAQSIDNLAIRLARRHE